ncbi:MAG: DUF3131 domain-containing protein [Bdellovibrionaceae bacterium]|nr:DUF3131 domain-containing protein [Pseudobdellovibrionaceae bacterium]
MKLLCKGLFFLCFVLAAAPASAQLTQDEIKQRIARTALNYFLENAHPKTGMVRDKADNFSTAPLDTDRVASIAATGFGLAVVTHASTQGLVEPAMAQQYALKVMKFARDSVPRRKGWFLHWVDWETGARAWKSEYSTIDTALFMAGALYAAQVYPKAEFAPIVHKIYQDIDFYDPLTDGGALPNKRTLSMGYFEETGYVKTQWTMYAEQMILLVLGLGHPTNPLPISTWTEWQRSTEKIGEREVMGLDQALFVHQYSQLFIDFRTFNDSFKNYFDNSVAITRVHRDMAKPDAKYKSLKEGFWGFSAGDAPNVSYGVYDAVKHSSTVCIGCALGSLVFSPSEVLSDATKWLEGPYKDRVWGKYGFVDSVDLDKDWFSNMVLGITVGPAYMSLVNTDYETSIWKTFMEIPEIKKGLERASRATSAHAPPPMVPPALAPSPESVKPEVTPAAPAPAPAPAKKPETSQLEAVPDTVVQAQTH